MSKTAFLDTSVLISCAVVDNIEYVNLDARDFENNCHQCKEAYDSYIQRIMCVEVSKELKTKRKSYRTVLMAVIAKVHHDDRVYSACLAQLRPREKEKVRQILALLGQQIKFKDPSELALELHQLQSAVNSNLSNYLRAIPALDPKETSSQSEITQVHAAVKAHCSAINSQDQSILVNAILVHQSQFHEFCTADKGYNGINTAELKLSLIGLSLPTFHVV